jgi:hypothetical protein
MKFLKLTSEISDKHYINMDLVTDFYWDGRRTVLLQHLVLEDCAEIQPTLKVQESPEQIMKMLEAGDE